MSCRPGIPWRVALQQSPPPLSRLFRVWQSCRSKVYNLSANGYCLTLSLSQPRGACQTGLKHMGTRLLFSSLSFLNNKNFRGPAPRKMWLLAGGNERLLVAINWLSRVMDHFVGTRLSVYGWAFYFGNVPSSMSAAGWPNVCVRCGSGHPAAALAAQGAVGKKWCIFRVYRCPACGATNPFMPDSPGSP